jgi:hypothetical protein
MSKRTRKRKWRSKKGHANHGHRPASLEEVQQWFARSQTALHDLLEEVARRMQVAYDNYHEMELANYKNMT